MAVEPILAPVRVASVPAGHPYVAHLGDGAARLPDPAPAGAPPGRWWPPVMLDAGWIARNAPAFDLMHVHFGAESVGADRLTEALAALCRAGRPLVFTVHDLDNPQLADQAAHREQLDLLVAAADALVTLTAGAAGAIERRWGRRATVVPHPHVHPLQAPVPLGRATAERTVGLHLRDLRPNIDGPGATARLLDATARLGVRARVELRDEVRDEAARDAIRALCAAAPHATLVERGRTGDAELARDLAALDACVLPYAHGTHSGWLELCWDLGVGVAAPPVGFFAEQHAGVEAPDAGGLARLLAVTPRPGSLARRRLVAERRAARRRRGERIGALHKEVYRAALGSCTMRP